MNKIGMIARLASADSIANHTDFAVEFQKELFIAYPSQAMELFKTVVFFGLDEIDIIKITDNFLKERLC